MALYVMDYFLNISLDFLVYQVVVGPQKSSSSLISYNFITQLVIFIVTLTKYLLFGRQKQRKFFFCFLMCKQADKTSPKAFFSFTRL